ncbi:XRE family transcriptional regulator, partial [Staphylococcus pseudintermedius]|nr:XRE family transcriptional regulator [Staphylococcus pseudintermedius]
LFDKKLEIPLQICSYVLLFK